MNTQLKRLAKTQTIPLVKQTHTPLDAVLGQPITHTMPNIGYMSLLKHIHITEKKWQQKALK